MAYKCDSANGQRTGITCCKYNNIIYEPATSSYAVIKSRSL